MLSSDDHGLSLELSSAGCPELRLAGEITVFRGAELHDLARQVAQGGGDAVVNCLQVQSLDCAALQILVCSRTP